MILDIILGRLRVIMVRMRGKGQITPRLCIILME